MKELVTVAFPGLGIEAFTMNKIAFTLFGKIEVRWYGIALTTAILLAILYTIWRGKRNEGIIPDDTLDVALVTVVCGVIGARLYYVLTTLDVYEYDSFYDVIAIWDGGIGMYGSIIGGGIAAIAMCCIKHIPWRKMVDMITPGLIMAQAIGRWGNFFNGEAYGYQITDTTKFYMFAKEFTLNSGEGTLFNLLRMELSPNMHSSSVMYAFHPTFFYEMLWNVIGTVLINIYYKHKRYDGQIAIMVFAWYGFGRMFVEGFRTDSLYIPGTSLRISQCLGFVFFLLGVGALIYFAIKKPKSPVRVRRKA